MFYQLYFFAIPIWPGDVTKISSNSDISRTANRRHMNLYILGISVSRSNYLTPLLLCLTNFIFSPYPFLARFPQAGQLVNEYYHLDTFWLSSTLLYLLIHSWDILMMMLKRWCAWNKVKSNILIMRYSKLIIIDTL